jgi:two-component system phosphate regulon sensor histidine kinase PhoR
MFGETLEMGRVKSEEKKQEYYNTIVKESERLTRLINNILDFSKMEAGKKQYKFENADLNTIVSNVMNTYSYHLHSEGFAPHIELANNLPMLSIDAEAVTEAIINLVDNAIKYSGEEKFLCLRTNRQGSMLAVEIEDHGVGIAEEHRKKIFDTFYRVGTALVHNTKGSGLGLALVKHIMDAHGGRVEVDSVVGTGSTFRLLFPLESRAKSKA